MVRDLVLDIDSRDLMMADQPDPSTPIFDTVWGKIFDEDYTSDALICNIIVPEFYWNSIKFTDNELVVNFYSEHQSSDSFFNIRLVKLSEGAYRHFESTSNRFGIPVVSYALTSNVASSISASLLKYININKIYTARLIQNSNGQQKCYVYSGNNTDILVDFCDSQTARLLSIASPGSLFRHPLTGVGISRYQNQIISHTDLRDRLISEFKSDGRTVTSATFDNTTGEFDVQTTGEPEIADSSLLPIDKLDIDFFKQFDDQFVRRNIVLNTPTESDFFKTLNACDYLLDLIFFKGEGTLAKHIATNVTPGAFDADGNTVASEEYYIVSETLDANSIIMFDDEDFDTMEDTPVFFINEFDSTHLYMSLIGQPYWINEKCHKCFLLKQKSQLRYMIKRENFRNKKGLYVIPATSTNVKNLLALAQNQCSGNIFGIVSDNTLISDISMDEATNHIYATYLNQDE